MDEKDLQDIEDLEDFISDEEEDKLINDDKNYD